VNSDSDDIRSKDIMVMSFLKIKYWGLFRDIEASRDLYTQIRLEDSRASLLFDDRNNEEYRKKHFNDLFKRLGYDSNDIQLLNPILGETFPDWRGNGHISEDDLLSNQRIGHRDLLDLYFSYGISHQSFKGHMEHVRPIVDRVIKGKYNENSLIKLFREFNRYALNEEHSGDVARLLARRLLSIQHQQVVSIVVWRCWLRALLKFESGSNEATNAILASILSGADDSTQRTSFSNTLSTSDIVATDQRLNDTITFFEDITEYLSDVYLGLLLLLFVFPARGNSFFLEYINRHGVRDLYLPILNYVDNYFIVQKRNVFREYSDSRHWRFVLYQWSLSISQNGMINSMVEDASTRQRAVNSYVFGLLDNNPKLIYQFIRGQFLTDGDQGTGLREWHIVSEFKQYSTEEDRTRITKMVREALSSPALKASQKEELVEFDRLFSQFVT
jgi:hypothetical protein